jgi:hypothetical protein
VRAPAREVLRARVGGATMGDQPQPGSRRMGPRLVQGEEGPYYLCGVALVGDTGKLHPRSGSTPPDTYTTFQL